MLRKFPETVASLPFLSSGLVFGYLLFLPAIDAPLYSKWTSWPYLALIGSIVLTAAFLTFPKFVHGKYTFQQFYCLALSTVFYLTSGLLFALTKEYASALFVGVVGYGISWVASLSYIIIRAEREQRPFAIALCHVWKMIGFAVPMTLISLLPLNVDIMNNFYLYFGIALAGTAVFFSIFWCINEFRQRSGIVYNHRDALDHDVSIANNYCKLFSKNEVIIERNVKVSSTGWKSTENLLGRRKNFTFLWPIYLLLMKFHSAILFYFQLLIMTLTFTGAYLENSSYSFLVLWIMAIGTILGCGAVLVYRIWYNYLIASLLAIIAIGTSLAFGATRVTAMTYCLWSFFLFLSVSASVPDIAILEMSRIKYNEIFLAIGLIIEVVTIASFQHFIASGDLQVNTETRYAWQAIAIIVILVVTNLIIFLHMPNTKDKSLLQIQNELLKHPSYFKFGIKASVAERERADQNMYVTQRSVNIFEEDPKKADFSLPDPPQHVNRNPEYDYSSNPNIPSIIPRVHVIGSRNSNDNASYRYTSYN